MSIKSCCIRHKSSSGYVGCSFSETNSMVSNVHNNVNVLVFLSGVLVSNRLDTRGFLTISRYIYGVHQFLPACMARVSFRGGGGGRPPLALVCPPLDMLRILFYM